MTNDATMTQDAPFAIRFHNQSRERYFVGLDEQVFALIDAKTGQSTNALMRATGLPHSLVKLVLGRLQVDGRVGFTLDQSKRPPGRMWFVLFCSHCGRTGPVNAAQECAICAEILAGYQP
ncbi:hypothetical protein [Deinococcus ruber]|uniref:Uncharacterized protein n=1 Tax=Deinococcus ruber TaxID=1848197 RepID=A0A918C108_9DEIO|nr:hypothetical protein [Deinococcus ruber]GGR00175.1 hypothetical protein GCM10008957_11130 [Deinococcus ruber]